MGKWATNMKMQIADEMQVADKHVKNTQPQE